MAVVLPHEETDRATRSLVDHFQRGFPLLSRPFAEIGAQIGLAEDAVIERFRRLGETGALSRIGAVVRPHAAGASTLAAVASPLADIERNAALINRRHGVNHNYQREHAFNLWFVVTGRTDADVAATLEGIERDTGLAVLNLPLEKSYHIDLGFALFGRPSAKTPPRPLTGAADDDDRRLLAAIEQGLPLVARPYAAVAERLGVAERAVIARLDSLQARGVVTRFGVVVRHRAFGYAANAMTVWDVADDRVDAVADVFAATPGVTLCYRRPRRLPGWRYNLFTMIHGKDRAAALGVVDGLANEAAADVAARDVLFSPRCFKQRGAVFSQREAA